MRNLYLEFKRKSDAEFQSIVERYERRIKLARKKVNVHNEIKNEVHKTFASIQSKLATFRNFLIEVRDEYDRDSTKEFEDIFNVSAKNIPRDQQEIIIEDLALYDAIDRFYEYWREKDSAYNDNAKRDAVVGTLKWVGDNETSFVQLIYSLYEAGYIINEQREITKLVVEVAEKFNFKLGKNWQSNFSKSINNRNSDYKPEILSSLERAFNIYRARQLNKGKKK